MRKIYSYFLSLMLTAFLCIPWTTTARADEEIILSEGFEGTLSDNWTKVSCHNSSIPYSTAKRSGTKGFRFYYNTNPPQYLISKELSIPSVATGVNVTFWYKNYSSSYPEIFQVGYSTTTNSTDAFTWETQITASNTQWTQYANSTPFPVGTKYIAIRYNSNNTYYLFIDDLEISYTYVASCPKPTDLTKGAVTATSATFTWTTGGSESEWQYICLPAETALDWSDANVQTATTMSATVNSLTAETDYKFYLRAYCGASDQSLDVVKEFTTPCEAKAVPFPEDFNSATGTTPECWSRIAYTNGTSSYPYLNSSNGVGSSKCMYFYGGTSSNSSILILPQLDAPTNTLAVSFDYRNTQTNANYGQAKLGYMTDPADASTFHPIKSFARNTTYTSVEEELMTGAPANSYIAIQFAGGSSNSYLAIDNIEVTVASACKKPGDLAVAASSSTSAKVSWTAKGEESAWNVRYSTDGENWTTVAAVTNPFTLTGLTESTTYEVQVQANCGGEQSQWTASKTVTTMCASTTGIGFSQDFNTEAYGSGKLPSCWTKISNDNYPYVYNYYANGCTGRCLYFYGGVTGTSEQIAILPPFSEATNTLYVTLYYSNSTEECDGWYDYSTSAYGQLAIGYITDPSDASTFVAQETFERVNAYTPKSVALTSAPEGSYVAIRYAGGTAAGESFVDDITISAIPSCLTPSGLSAEALTSTSAQISWSSAATAWNLQYSVKGANDWTAVNNVTENPYTLAGLAASTDYEIQVQTVCGEEETSNWTSSAYFNTPCDVASMPFSQNFNGLTTAGQIPSCWDNSEGTTTSANYKWSYFANGHEGACLRFDSYDNYADRDNYLKTPEIAVTEAAILTFWYKNPAGGDYSVYYSLDGGVTKTEIITGLTGVTDWTKYSAQLPAACVGEDVTIIFKGTSNYAYGDAYLSLDDISVEAVPSCVAPSAPVASSITANSAQLSWTAGGSETAWKLQYSVDGTNWIDANGGAAVTNPYTLNGLTANNVAYYARVKAVCGSEDESQWSDISEVFYTECEARSLPFNEDFNADLACWTQTNCVSGTGLTDNEFMFKYTYDPSQYLITPAIDTENKPVTVEFDYYVSNSSYPETFLVGYSTTTNEISAFTWGEAVTATNTSTNVLRYFDVLPAGVKYVAIQHASYDKYFLYIDNFAVEEMPACPNVKTNSLAASLITANSATVSWNVAYNETAWNLQYKAEDGEWSEAIAVVTTPSYNLTGLDANTVYYVRVQANCGEDGTSQYTDGAFFFQTDCEAMTVDYGNEWNYGFEAEEGAAVNTVPACWNQICSIENPSYAYALVDNAGAKTGSQFMHMEVYHNYNAIIVLPAFTNDLSELQISFAYRNDQTSTSYGQLEIGYYLNGVFTPVGDKLTRVASYTDMKVEMPENAPEGAKMAFRIVGSGGYRRTHAYIDDIIVSKKAIKLSQAEDNTAALEANNGQTLDVQIDRTFFPGVGFNTICLPFSLPTLVGTPLEGGELLAFKYGYVENGELLLRVYPTDAIEAGVPYLISWETGENIVSPIFKNVTIAASEGKAVGENDDVKFVGIFAPQIFPQGDKTKIFVLANNQMAWSGVEATAANSLKSFRAYFQTITEVGGGANNAPIYNGMPARIVKQESSATDIDNIYGNDVKSIKLLENNQVVIIRNGVKYNVQGQVIK